MTIHRRDEKQQLPLPQEEIFVILNAADEISARGGRTMLAKLLKGSKDKRLIGLELDKTPCYGYFAKNTLDEITTKIDWMLKHEFLAIEIYGKLPLLVFTERGWKITRSLQIESFLNEWNTWLDQGKVDIDMTYLKERNREMMLLFLERIKESGDLKYVPYMRMWAAIAFKKVATVINMTIDEMLKQSSVAKGSSLYPREREEVLMALQMNMLVLQPKILKCWDCRERFVFEVEEQEFFKLKGFNDPKRCPECRERKMLRRMGIDLEAGDSL
ncbi:RQC-minor-1 family DNA-binding protein [Cohnella abietis]|uniref:RQC domain-containing protein n=1 Tax=Cohnella abietis TaxID=2507935 RepID=A0A3T1DBS4_9BACL|nr:RQC-minor-1 family DNA-binding protein [Cohnella abietis]BBI35560.1 hypothetical protein KCTCHS21_49590 [Cohnella abietis]